LRSPKCQSGLTLVEVLVGVVILGAALAPAALIMGDALTGSAVQLDAARSLFLAQGRMEEIRILDYNQISPGTGLSGWVTAPDSVYRAVKVTVNPGGTFDPNVKSVEVTVGTVTLTTLRVREFEP